jgi:hypothetical protein
MVRIVRLRSPQRTNNGRRIYGFASRAAAKRKAAGLVTTPPADGYQARDPDCEFTICIPVGIPLVVGEVTNNGRAVGYFFGKANNNCWKVFNVMVYAYKLLSG